MLIPKVVKQILTINLILLGLTLFIDLGIYLILFFARIKDELTIIFAGLIVIFFSINSMRMIFAATKTKESEKEAKDA
jgi:hypothetical protein